MANTTNIKPEILQDILSDAETATPIEGRPYSYSPEEYAKLRRKNLAMETVNRGLSDEPNFRAHHPVGSIEFDEKGRLKKLGRTEPMLLDLSVLTANRYAMYRVNSPAGDYKKHIPKGTYIVVVFGQNIVNAISASAATVELPPTIKAYRFERKTDVEGTGENAKEVVKWEYVRAEFIEKEEAYKMTRSLDEKSALGLLNQIEAAGESLISERTQGDSLDDIA